MEASNTLKTLMQDLQQLDTAASPAAKHSPMPRKKTKARKPPPQDSRVARAYSLNRSHPDNGKPIHLQLNRDAPDNSIVDKKTFNLAEEFEADLMAITQEGAQSTGTDEPESALLVQASSMPPDEQADNDAFQADLEAIMRGHKIFDPETKQIVHAADDEVREKVRQAPTPTPPPSTTKSPKTVHPHDVFDQMSQARSHSGVQTPKAHQVFEQMTMGLSEGHTNQFDLGTVSLEQAFQEFDEKLDQKERLVRAKSQRLDELAELDRAIDAAEKKKQAMTRMMSDVELAEDLALLEEAAVVAEPSSPESVEAGTSASQVKALSQQVAALSAQLSAMQAKVEPKAEDTPLTTSQQEESAQAQVETFAPQEADLAKAKAVWAEMMGGPEEKKWKERTRDEQERMIDIAKARFEKEYESLRTSLLPEKRDELPKAEDIWNLLMNNLKTLYQNRIEQGKGKKKESIEEIQKLLRPLVNTLKKVVRLQEPEESVQKPGSWNFWSGGPDAQAAATKVAKGGKGIVLENLAFGRLFNGFDLYDWEDRLVVWEALSGAYAEELAKRYPQIKKQTSLRLFITAKIKEGGVLHHIELPALQKALDDKAEILIHFIPLSFPEWQIFLNDILKDEWVTFLKLQDKPKEEQQKSTQEYAQRYQNLQQLKDRDPNEYTKALKDIQRRSMAGVSAFKLLESSMVPSVILDKFKSLQHQIRLAQFQFVNSLPTATPPSQ